MSVDKLAILRPASIIFEGLITLAFFSIQNDTSVSKMRWNYADGPSYWPLHIQILAGFEIHVKLSVSASRNSSLRRLVAKIYEKINKCPIYQNISVFIGDEWLLMISRPLARGCSHAHTRARTNTIMCHISYYFINAELVNDVTRCDVTLISTNLWNEAFIFCFK